MGPTEQEVALISHGRKILEVYKHKGVINGYIERPDTPRGDDEPAIAKHESWQSVTAKHTQSSQLLQSIERSTLKLVEHVASADTPAAAASLSHVTAPLVAQLRQLLRQKQLLEDDMERDFHALGPPVVLDASNNVPSAWLAHADMDALVHAKVAPLEAELAQAKTTIEDMQVKLHAYKVQLQQPATSTPSPIASSTSSSPRAHIQRLERHIQEKDELIRALRETLDDVANDSSRMEKLLIAQSDSIAMLQSEHQVREATAAVPASALSPPTSETQDLVPPDDGHTHRVEDFDTPLPPGWEMRVTNTGDVYFIHRHSKVTTWVDPRSHPIQLQPSLTHNAPLSSQYAIEFHEKRPIGVLFQPNAPVDQGACVRRILEETPAEYAAQIQPGHQLVAVNGHRIQEASFRHIMLLLQGGFRPLTLTFDRLVREGTLLQDDEGQEGTRATGDETAGYSLADQLITGVFSLVWAAPDEPSSAVQPI
ncbi:hypothetical protein SPRG_02586 [Saprolegnia parasitica CBS 223.65]|uniref:WW domain-containing protein n=1 Tax=Saprolegnia parasitica (strain CBS 223.65) TaxID=695850 RepID=A0A067CUG1_SAPPC|nr:hypothetical protein SPRG_02586 [Saprolegnia parasitica CBS 223.65]KDO32895.1 hypothetical protein SPRG_02586 [Saprolegnia parasitica CBS 223.65]|eukprot:XP_012196545.1 hypothetical protein SPRG_02586 [Saprolegnia parasitica CBS 223.65]